MSIDQYICEEAGLNDEHPRSKTALAVISFIPLTLTTAFFTPANPVNVLSMMMPSPGLSFDGLNMAAVVLCESCTMRLDPTTLWMRPKR